MRESRFIELLNLYVDQQLSDGEARELEREIARRPARAQTYQQYCRMQKACTLLFEQERIHAPNTGVLSRSLSDVDRKVVAFPEPRAPFFRRVTVYATGLAAAACIAFVIVNRTEIARLDHSGSPFGEARVAQAAAPAIRSAAPVSPASPRRPEYFAVFNTRSPIAEENSGDLVLENQNLDRVSYEWMRGVELAPVMPISDQITLASTETKTETRDFQALPATFRTKESAAFQFQR